MRVDVVGKQIDVTDAIREYAETKAEKLVRYFDGTQLVTVVLDEQTKHKEFFVEVVVDVEKHDNFVAHARHGDLYACIDQAMDKAQRQLHDFKEKLKQNKRPDRNGEPNR